MDSDTESFDAHIRELLKNGYVRDIHITPHVVADPANRSFTMGYEARLMIELFYGSTSTHRTTVGHMFKNFATASKYLKYIKK
jgi:hypothetical protein